MARHPNERFRRSVRYFYGYLAAVFFAGAAPFGALALIDSARPVWRVLGVAIGIGAWIPWMVFLARIIAAGDEFTRRIHLVALAYAFGGALLLLSAFDWLDRADIVKQPPLPLLWVSIAALWVICLVLVKRHYERAG